MLVLSRKCGERVVIGPHIELIVLDVRGTRVTLGFVAPRETSIHRQEVFERIHAEVCEKVPSDLDSCAD